jgi:large subunit ribosomal protein L7/L12
MKPTTTQTTITNEMIAARAYERFLARGGEHGHDVEDWLAAEAELKAPSKVSAAAGVSRSYDVVLVDPGPNPIEVMRAIRDATGLTITDVKTLIDARPRPIKNAQPLKNAEELRNRLQKFGARVEVRAVNHRS